jgi:hypothetical protein
MVTFGPSGTVDFPVRLPARREALLDWAADHKVIVSATEIPLRDREGPVGTTDGVVNPN